MVHDAGHKVVVGPSAEKAARVLYIDVRLGHGAQLGHDLEFRERSGELDLREAMRRWDGLEERIDALSPDAR